MTITMTMTMTMTMAMAMAMAMPDADHRDQRGDGRVLARRREVRAYLGGSGAGVS